MATEDARKAVDEAALALDSDEESLDQDTHARHYDEETLAAEEEAERLLTGVRDQQHDGHGARRSQRRKDAADKWRGSRSAAASELTLKIEEGGRSSDDSAHSSDVDGNVQRPRKPSSRLSKCAKFTSLHLVILLAFFALAYGAFRASRSLATLEKAGHMAKSLSNGTHVFGPTTILISLDGFRADFLHRGLTPCLSSLVQQGVSPKYMMPSFPSLTFPNHFTLVTGKYPSVHGIVGNNFFDPVMQKQFTYANASLSMVPEYWNAEPLWETAELQGVRTAIHMWPGSEAHIGSVEPAFVDKFNAHEALNNKVDRILGWLDLPGPDDTNALSDALRPQLIAAYVPNVDVDGHKFGPNSTYIRSTIAEVDGMLASLFRGIEDRNLTSIVNIVVVSDHGMASTATSRTVQLDDLLDTEEIEHIDGWPLYGLRPFNQSDAKLSEIHGKLKEQEAKHQGKFKVYLRDGDMPERFHFSNNQRIAPLWIVPEVGWAIAPKHEFDVSAATKSGTAYAPAGLHGYDNDHPLMRAIFVARGPAFPHPQGSIVEPFYNTAVYGIICQTLGIAPEPNNGTISLPFKTTGLHDPEEYAQPPDDPPPIAHVDANVISPPATPSVTGGNATPESGASTDLPQSSQPPAASEPETSEKPGDEHTSWRQWIDGKIEQAKHWVTGLFGEHRQATDAEASDEKR